MTEGHVFLREEIDHNQWKSIYNPLNNLIFLKTRGCVLGDQHFFFRWLKTCKNSRFNVLTKREQKKLPGTFS